MRRKVIQTADGSSTIQLTDIDEHYHSTHGALQEARHVFIENGLAKLQMEKISVFELGFGTGLNAILTLEYARKCGVAVDYAGLEAFPVEFDLINQLNYQSLLPAYSEEFIQLHEVSWNEAHRISPDFQIQKIDEKIQDYTGLKNSSDIIYFDAFGHRAQSEMWEFPIIQKMHELLKVGGVFVTYAARGQLKRDLQTLGFDVKKLPGPPGKREMTFAVKQ